MAVALHGNFLRTAHVVNLADGGGLAWAFNPLTNELSATVSGVVGGTVAVSAGGTGFSSYTAGDLLYANGGASLAKLAIGSAGDVLRVSGGAPAWQAPSTLTANPSGTVGLSAVNGSASTFMRSDAAPAISQAIAPTWTAQHVFSRARAGANDHAVTLRSTHPSLLFDDTDAGADAGRYQIRAEAGGWLLRALNDAETWRVTS